MGAPISSWVGGSCLMSAVTLSQGGARRGCASLAESCPLPVLFFNLTLTKIKSQMSICRFKFVIIIYIFKPLGRYLWQWMIWMIRSSPRI